MTCPRCGAANLTGLPACANCGQDLAVTGPPEDDIDESTRLLCIGAQVDRQFADRAIREFLGQPYRAAAPTLGVDAETVLRECLEARRRRRVRDGLLAVLMLLFAVLSPMPLTIWAVVAVLWRIVGPSRRRLDHAPAPALSLRALLALGALVLLSSVLGTAWFVASMILPTIDTLSGTDGGGLGPTGPGSLSPFGPLTAISLLVLPLLLSGLMLLVLWTDRQAVWSAVCQRLRREQFARTTAGGRRRQPATVASLRYDRLTQNLAEISGQGPVNCVVYRGQRPFIGNGDPLGPWSIAISLEPAGQDISVLRTADGSLLSVQDSARRPASGAGDPQLPQLSVLELYQAVRADLLKLRGITSLSPSHRLLRITTAGKVFVPARSLLMHLGGPELREILARRHERPRSHVSEDLLGWIAESPREWLRYYDCFVVESWDREATVSLLVHFGLDERNLYLECIPCALRPVNPRYRWPDGLSSTTSGPALLDALGSWTVLPLTVIGRAVHLVRRTGEPFVGDDDPRRYGASISLRELAAGPEYADYAQESDVHRYLQVLQTRLIRAVGAHLESRGISVVDFMRQANRTTTVNQIGGDYHHVHDTVMQNSNIGRDNSVAVQTGGTAR